MLTETQFRKLYRASAWYDIFVTSAFATPWTIAILFSTLSQISIYFGLPGRLIEPDIYHIFFGNLMGSLVVVWSVARLKLDMPILARFDSVGRFFFSSWMIYALMNGASYILFVLLVPEILLGIAQSLPVTRLAEQHPASA